MLVSGIIAGGIVLDPVGIAYGVISCVAFAIHTTLIQKLGRDESTLTSTFTIAASGLLLSCIVFAPSVPSMFQLSVEQMLLDAGLGFDELGFERRASCAHDELYIHRSTLQYRLERIVEICSLDFEDRATWAHLQLSFLLEK